MTEINKLKMKAIRIILFILCMLWLLTTMMIQSFKCDSLTQMQLFKRIPNTVVLDWYDCPK